MKRSKATFITLLLLTMHTLLCAATPASNGYVPVRNFSTTDYSANAQNWGCVQDSLGRVYVANGYGMLCFDGASWGLYHLPNYTSVRSLLYDGTTNRIYAGGSEEFGYFAPTTNGRLEYTSLSKSLHHSMQPTLTEIWKIMKTGDKIWFQGDYHFFCYDKNTLTTYTTKSRITHSSGMGPSVFMALDNGHILHIFEEQIKPLKGLRAVAGLKITALLPFANSTKMLIGTPFDGLFIYDGKTTRRYDCDINEFLIKNQLFCASAHGSNYVFGTVNRGAVVRNFDSGKVDYINKDMGLLNNTVLAADFDADGNLWLSLDFGLGYAIFDGPMRNLTGSSSPIGAGYASLIKDGQIYLGTNQGLYSARYPLEPNPAPTQFAQLIQGQIWSITQDGNTIFVGADAGAYVSEGGKQFHKVSGIDGTSRVRMLNGSTDRALAITYHGFHLLGKTNGQWTDLGRIGGYDDISADFIQDRFGDIWLPHWRKGVFRLRFNEKAGTFGQCRLFNKQTGLSDDKNTSLGQFNNRIIVSTESGFCYFNTMTEEMQPDHDINNIFGTSAKGSFRSLGDSVVALIDNQGMSLAKLNQDGKYTVDTVSLRNIGNKLIPGYTDVYLAPDGNLFLSGYDGFWQINLSHRPANPEVAMPFFSTVYANGDSLIYRAQNGSHADVPPVLKVPYEMNTLRFNFGYADFSNPDAVEFSSYLESYDDAPSEFSVAKSREYTKIPDGTYTLHLKSRDTQSRTIKASSLTIVVSPPWYRTTLAKIIWALLFAMLIVGAYIFVTKRIAISRQRLEKRKREEYSALEIKASHEAMLKDIEIANLQSERLEQDIKHKSQELSDTTKNLIQKNEVLQDIADKLKHVNELLSADLGRPAAQRIIGKIQQMIDDDLSHDNDWTRFSGNFDVVYANFTKHLMELHPNLSVADKRLCCYIRMGLSSKEIAPLINISYKSVEMARYRVRKKIGLAPGDSLTSYLNQL